VYAPVSGSSRALQLGLLATIFSQPLSAGSRFALARNPSRLQT